MLQPPKKWSESVAELVVDALAIAGIVSEKDTEKAKGIVQEEVLVRLCLGDIPMPESLNKWQFVVDEMSANVYELSATRVTGNVISVQGRDVDKLFWQAITKALEIESEIST